ncbi:hypothetical protein NBRC111452_2359 [Companilactobacillus farciminis]|nr:hypothetical protein NBRC111452_2359 [Companilactobacillus farciminis]
MILVKFLKKLRIVLKKLSEAQKLFKNNESLRKKVVDTKEQSEDK